VLFGALIGALLSLTSVGAGAIGVTVLMLLYPALPLPRIVAADIAYAVPLTLVAGLGHASIGSVDWPLLAKLLAGSLPGVRSVVALNPWVYATDRADLAGRSVLVMHGTADRVADPERARAVASAIADTTDVTFVPVEGGRHAMLRQGSTFERTATDFVLSSLLGERLP